MGPTVNGLDKLLRMPTGCGEQTMIGFAPDVFITNYLKATNQLSSDIEEKALNFMEKGWSISISSFFSFRASNALALYNCILCNLLSQSCAHQ